MIAIHRSSVHILDLTSLRYKSSRFVQGKTQLMGGGLSVPETRLVSSVVHSHLSFSLSLTVLPAGHGRPGSLRVFSYIQSVIEVRACGAD